MNYRKQCSKCDGKGYTRGALGKAFRSSCDVCDGLGYVELKNVTVAPVLTKLDDDADVVLRHALGELDTVAIVGYTKDGAEYFASNVANGPDVLWMLHRSAHNLLTIGDDEE